MSCLQQLPPALEYCSSASFPWAVWVQWPFGRFSIWDDFSSQGSCLSKYAFPAQPWGTQLHHQKDCTSVNMYMRHHIIVMMIYFTISSSLLKKLKYYPCLTCLPINLQLLCYKTKGFGHRILWGIWQFQLFFNKRIHAVMKCRFKKHPLISFHIAPMLYTFFSAFGGWVSVIPAGTTTLSHYQTAPLYNTWNTTFSKQSDSGTFSSLSKWRMSTKGAMDGRPWAHWKGNWQEDKDATKL